MFDLSSIYVPVDFSRGSRSALAVARLLAEGGEVTLVASHVVPPMMRYMRRVLFPYAALGEDEVAILEEVRQSGFSALHRYLKLDDFAVDGTPLGEGEEAPHQLEVTVADEETPVVDLLLDRLRQLRAELMVVGASGETEATPGLVGPTALRLVAQSPRPVLLSRAADRRRRIEHVLVALDMSGQGRGIYEAALATALRLSAKLTVLTVLPDPLESDVCGVLGGAISLDRPALAKKGRKETSKILARYRSGIEVPFPLKEAHGKLPIEEEVVVGDPTVAIVQRAAEGDVDLIVMGRHGQNKARLPSAIGRTTRAVLGLAPCYVMVVP